MNRLKRYGIERYTGQIEFLGMIGGRRVIAEDGQYYLAEEIDKFLEKLIPETNLNK